MNPCCIIVRNEEAIKAVLLGYAEKRTEAIQRGLGFKKLFGINVKCLHVVAGGCYIDLTHQEVKSLYSDLLAQLRGTVDVIQIDSFPSNYALLKLYKQHFFRHAVVRQNTQCRSNVSVDYDTFYKNRSKNTRHNLRKREKQLTRHFDANEIDVKVYRTIDYLETALTDIEQVAVDTYQRAMSVGFQKDEETQTIYQKMLKQKSLYAFVLYVKGVPCSFHTGMVFNRIFHGLTKGYSQDYADYNVGHYLFIKMIRYLCDADDIDYYDFGIGDSYYKNQVSDIKLPVFQAKLFLPGIRGFMASNISRADRAFKNGIRQIKKYIGKKGQRHTGT